jgi:hypothetical protein
MIWDIFLMLYLLVGVIISTCAKIGHRVRFGYKMHWTNWMVGVITWPIILLIGGRKK